MIETMPRRVLPILFLLSVAKSSLSCHTFGNLDVEIQPKVGQAFNKAISGCVEPSQFADIPDVEVSHVKFNGQAIRLLKKGTVQNLARLKLLSFNSTNTEIVDPEAFRHLPRLTTLFLIQSRIEVVRYNVFQDLPSLAKLSLRHNFIRTIEDYAFSDMQGLKYINLGTNKLEEWNPKWFTNTTALEEIDFQKNSITKIPKLAFRSLNKLKKVVLDGNKIREIEGGAFESVENLSCLSLKNNCLQTIVADIFPPNLKIESLFLDYNIFNFLGNEVLDRISAKEISLSGNPWKCPCLQRTLFWFYQKHGSSKFCGGCAQNDKPICVIPQVYSNTCLDIIDEEATRTYFNLTGTETTTKCAVS